MRFGILDNSRIFVTFDANECTKYSFKQQSFLWLCVSYCLYDIRLSLPVGLLQKCDSGSLARMGGGSLSLFTNFKFHSTMPTNLKFANDAQGVDNARTSPRKREIPSLSLKRQLKYLKAMIRTERNNKLRAYSFILDNCIFDCYSHYCMTTLPDSIPDEFIEIMDIMSLKTDPTLLKNDALWKS